MANGAKAPAKTTDWTPTAKVSIGALAGAASTLLITVLKNWHVDLFKDSAAVGALTSIVTFAVQYWIPEKR